jgi:hypothetical protein
MSKESLFTGDIRPESVGGPYPYAVVYIDHGHAGGHYEVHNVMNDTVLRTRHMGPAWEGGAEEAGVLASQARQGCHENPMFWAPRLPYSPVPPAPPAETATCGTYAFEADLLSLMKEARRQHVHLVTQMRPMTAQEVRDWAVSGLG